MIDTAVIMAAGKGTRFGLRTHAMPKGFIKFKGKAMIERSIENLLSVGIKRIIIGTGYYREWYEKLCIKYPQIITVFSPEFAESNSMETLYVCRHAIGGNNFLLLESDIVYEEKALIKLLESEYHDILLAADITKFQDQYYIGVDAENNLCCCSINKEVVETKCGNIFGELVGIHKISNEFFKEMTADYELNRSEYMKRGYEFEMEDIATKERSSNECFTSRHHLHVLKLHNLQWYEIDDEKDLAYAEKNVIIS